MYKLKMENNNDYLNKIKTIETNLDDKILDSDMERLQKEKENENEDEKAAQPKEIILQVEQEINNNKEDEEEDENLEINDDDIKIEKKLINIIKVKAEEILNETKLEEKENLDLLKLELTFIAKIEYKWDVYRTPQEVKNFFKKLYKFLNHSEKEKDQDLIDSIHDIKKLKDQQILDSVPQIKEELQKILQNDFFNNNTILNEFLNIGGSSFSIYNGGSKPFEGWGEKKADPHCLRKAFAIVCKCLECWIFKQYNERWIVLKDDMITYSDLSKSQGAKHIYFFDEKIKATRNGKFNIKITNLSRILELKFKTYFERELWMNEIEKRIQKFKELIKNNKYKAFTNEKKNNYAHWFVDGKDYFEDLYEKLMDAKRTIFITDWWLSPEVWLKRPILEADYIKPSKKKKDNLSRLMDILYFKANEGIKIYILIYYECSLALTLNSKYTQDTLEKLHKNIKVTRHPKDKFDLLWSHHEKLVVIDQQIGYVGGLDLCWGRYDFPEHPIYEPDNSEQKYYFPFIDYSNARICDFSNVEDYLKESVPRKNSLRMPWHDVHTRIIGPAVGDIAKHFVERWNHDNYDNKTETNPNTVRGSTNFKENNKLKSSNFSKNGFMNTIFESIQKHINNDNTNNNKDINVITEKTISEEESKTSEVYENYNIQNKIKIPPDFTCQNNDINDLGNINENEEQKKAEENISINIKETKINIIQVENDTKSFDDSVKIKNSQNNKEPEKSLKFMDLLKKGEQLRISKTLNFEKSNSDFELKKKEWMENFNEIDADHLLVPKTLHSMIVSDEVQNDEENKENKNPEFYNKFINNIKKNANLIFNDTFKANNEIETIINEKYIKKNSPPSNIQVLRSVGGWSLGLSSTENSILEAYYQLIEKSKYYIYIENQFFISKPFEDDGKNYLVENKIALYIRNRILKAYKEKSKFKVWILIPLLPGFAGEPEDSGTLQIILKYTYNSICKYNGLSIIEKLQEELVKEGLNWEDYIGFYSLRNHGLVNGMPKTEIIYIHSKLMIVDDLYVICGSANINDRSMKGSRDSEFAVLIKERRTDFSLMNNKNFKAAKFATSLRKALMAEHLGLRPDDEILRDPLSDKLHELIKKRAKDNTFTYGQIFGCYPDDRYTKFSLIKKDKIQNKAQEDYLKKNYEENKNKIIGHIVEFPLHFLEDEELGIPFFSKENLVPERNFT